MFQAPKQGYSPKNNISARETLFHWLFLPFFSSSIVSPRFSDALLLKQCFTPKNNVSSLKTRLQPRKTMFQAVKHCFTGFFNISRAGDLFQAILA
jgi:hypothetical protein